MCVRVLLLQECVVGVEYGVEALCGHCLAAADHSKPLDSKVEASPAQSDDGLNPHEASNPKP